MNLKASNHFLPSATSAGSLFALPGEAAHEQVHWFHDAASGLQAIVAIHSTARGPAFGGCRLWQYESCEDALTDALRLSHGMTLKNALADLPFGGGKAVILHPGVEFDRQTLFRAFGSAVDSLRGRYVTAEDVGTTTGDMRAVQEFTDHVSGIPRDAGFGGDPSPKTAWGVFVGIREALRSRFNKSTLDGVRVAVQGLGSVGSSLCALLSHAGARLVVADVDGARAESARAMFGAEVVAPDAIALVQAEVFAPCAMGGVLNAQTIEALQTQLVAGAANNQLATLEDGERLHRRGIVYLPDFLVNAGGIVSVAREHLGAGVEQSVMTEIGRIAGRVVEVLDRSAASGNSTNAVALAWAREKISANP